MKGVSIYPGDVLRRKLEASAKKDNRSLNNFILEILTKHCNSNKR